MFSLILFGSLIVLAIGGTAKYVLDRQEHELRITRGEFVVASLVMLLLVIPLTAWLGLKIAFNSTVTYNEFRGGYELEAVWVRIHTSRDGAGAHKYDCDPYQVYVVDSPAYTDDKGNYHPEQGHYETRYHSCPYTTEEWTFLVKTTLGDKYIAENNLPTNPDQYRYVSPEGWTKRAPDWIPRGVPIFWQRVKDRIDSNQPGPVTERDTYPNYILPSQHTILKKYSADIDRYKAAGLFPQVSTKVSNYYYADRAYFVGVNPAGDWQKYVNAFDAAMGMELQGDLHLVIVDSSKISDPENYAQSLFAYWQSPDFGKDAISKNSLMVVLGTRDGQTVEWARAGTGMPKGNETLQIAIRDQMPGTKLDPASVLGPPTGELFQKNGKTMVRINHSQGKLDQLVWGADKFQRVHMADYRYLIHEIQPTGSQIAWILFVITIFGCIAWGICIALGPRTYHGFRGRWR